MAKNGEIIGCKILQICAKRFYKTKLIGENRVFFAFMILPQCNFCTQDKINMCKSFVNRYCSLYQPLYCLLYQQLTLKSVGCNTFFAKVDHFASFSKALRCCSNTRRATTSIFSSSVNAKSVLTFREMSIQLGRLFLLQLANSYFLEFLIQGIMPL